MDIQTMLNNAMTASRAKEMLTSEQLTLGELTLKLEAVKNKDLPIYFDNTKKQPTGLDSWRGSYCELSINYKDGGTCYEQAKPDCKRDEFGDHDYKCPCGGSEEIDTTLPKNPTANDLLEKLKLINGKYVVGYKGGDFTMGKTTPLWVASYGSSAGYKTNKNYSSMAVVDIKETENKVVIVTKLKDY